jgi:A/G-specific adenine glycosylase
MPQVPHLHLERMTASRSSVTASQGAPSDNIHGPSDTLMALELAPSSFPRYSTSTMAASLSIGDCKDRLSMGERLVSWYSLHRRDLPWRNTQDPYSIWVAEVMLQQTRVETVLLYYGRFLVRFPTVESLAAAPVDDVLKAWEGLGYYARARNLHAAARHVVHNLGGLLPQTLEALLHLPGVGQYTAAAIASIAFGQDAIALDGNLRRILCRVFAIDDDPGRPGTQRTLEQLAHAMSPPGRASDFNQSLMDVGASICIPSNPRCLICPLLRDCRALREGIQTALPIRATRSHRPHRDVTAGVIWDGNGRFLITQRPYECMLGGLWEFPGGKRRPGEDLRHCLHREIGEEIGIEIQIGDLLCSIDHSFTHFHMTLYAYQCRWSGGNPQCLGCEAIRWVTLDELDAFAFPVADQKIISVLRKETPTSS